LRTRGYNTNARRHWGFVTVDTVARVVASGVAVF